MPRAPRYALAVDLMADLGLGDQDQLKILIDAAKSEGFDIKRRTIKEGEGKWAGFAYYCSEEGWPELEESASVYMTLVYDDPPNA